jgi:hypothetical protein
LEGSVSEQAYDIIETLVIIVAFVLLVIFTT